MSSILVFQHGPLAFTRETKILKYYYNSESGFIYDDKLCSIVGKKVDGKYFKLSEEDKKWCRILKYKVFEEDSFFNMICLTDDLLEKNKGREKEILSKLREHIDKTSKETMEKIKKFQTRDELIEHVKKYPTHVHDCLYNCDWKVFDLELVKRLVNLKLLDPFEKSSAYDGDDGYTNLNFYEHLKLQLKEFPLLFSNRETIRNRYKLDEILNYLKKNKTV